jgi:hypothetical protein
LQKTGEDYIVDDWEKIENKVNVLASEAHQHAGEDQPLFTHKLQWNCDHYR